jgi:hypothetical protein
MFARRSRIGHRSKLDFSLAFGSGCLCTETVETLRRITVLREYDGRNLTKDQNYENKSGWDGPI